MRIDDHTRTNHDSHPNYESGCLDRAHAQFASLSRIVADAIVESRPRGDFVEAPCKLAPAIRRRRLSSPAPSFRA